MVRGMKPGADMMREGEKLCRYEQDHWISGRTLYLKVTAIEYERATEESFNLAGRRRMRALLAKLGYDPALARGIGGVIEWDRSRNWADLLTETITYQLARPLPLVDDDEAAA